MAALLPTYQQFFDTKQGVQIGIHRVTIVTSEDTVTVPLLASSTASIAAVEVDDGNNDSGITVSVDDAYTVALDGGTAGGIVWSRIPAGDK